MKYVSLDALVAEINKRITDAPINNIGHQRVWAYNDVKDIIDTLEVKEVDINEEAKRKWDSFSLCYDESRGCDVVVWPYWVYKQVCKHFFELGMRFNNPITASDRGTAEEIIINLKRVEQDYRINLTKEIEWVRNQVKKGE